MFCLFPFIVKIFCWILLIKLGTAHSGLEDAEYFDYYDYYFDDPRAPFNYDAYYYYPGLNGYHNYPYYDNYDYSPDNSGNSVNGFPNVDEGFGEDIDLLGLDFKSENELLSIIKELAESMNNFNQYNTDHEGFPVLQRRKRGIRKSSSSSRSRSSSSSSSSSSSRRGSWLRRESRKEREKSKPKKEEKDKKDRESTTVDKSSYPKASYPPLSPSAGGSPSTGYPKPSAPPLESGPIDKSSYPKASYEPSKPTLGGSPSDGYPSGSYPNQPSSGYPNQPSSGYPNQPSSGYPNQPSPGYPHSPSPGYPHPPSPGYPHQPSPGYPHQPSPGYPHPPSTGYPHSPSPGYPNQPSSGYPQQPSSGYPQHGAPGYPNQPAPGYPIQPSPGYPYPPSSGYPTRGKPSLGIPPISGAYPGVGYPKMSKKEKVISKVKQALGGYAMYKMHNKHNSRAKFISPGMGMMGMGMGMGMGAGMGMHGFHGGGGSMGGMAGIGSMKVGKKILGTIIKLQIAKYALKFGFKAAQAYFEYKLGRSIEERMIDKFISRYHKQRTRNYYRQNRMLYKNKKDFKQENITLGEDCIRNCEIGGSLTCFFSFHVHLYQYLSRACYDCPNKMEDCGRPDCVVGSGRQKLVTLVNRQLPGPTIQVCEGDKILLEVQNELPSSGVTIHFRGQSYSEEPYMEGTIGLTSTIVSPGEIFAYRFKADVPGTHFWHANTGVARSDGVYGVFVVKGKKDPLEEQFDSDLVNQTIIISEDFVKRGEEQLVNLYHKKGKIEVFSLLINGKGFKQDEAFPESYSKSIYSEIMTLSGKRNRIRIISAVSSNCPLSFRIKGRSFTVISIDGFPVTPNDTHTLLISPGERIDIVLKDVPIGLHWIEIQGFLDCENQKQFAILSSKEQLEWIIPLPNDTKTETTSGTIPTENPFTAFNEMEKLTGSIVYCNSTKIMCSRNYSSISPMPSDLNTPNITLYLSLTSRAIHNEHFYSLIHYDIASLPVEEQSLTHQINNLTLRVAHEPLLINQRPLKSGVCSSAGVLRQHCVEDFCECLHLLQLPLRKTVEVVFINEGPSNSLRPQTMYLHGYNSWVLSQSKEFIYSNETLDNSTSSYLDRLRVIIRDAEELLLKNTTGPVRMNSITVPEGGYAVIRFKAENPGFWLLESSSVFRSTTGMGMVFQVGEKKDLPDIPKKLFKC